MLTETTASRFEEDVLQAPGPVVVDFWAPWCGPCRALAPHLERLAEKYDGRVAIIKLNVDTAPEYRQRYNLKGVPALLLFDGGQKVDEVLGASPRQIEEMMERHAHLAPPIERREMGPETTQETHNQAELDRLIRRR